jgi:hypothetical protein
MRNRRCAGPSKDTVRATFAAHGAIGGQWMGVITWRIVLPTDAPCSIINGSLGLLVCSSARLLVCSSARLLVCSSARLLVCSSARLLKCPRSRAGSP